MDKNIDNGWSGILRPLVLSSSHSNNECGTIKRTTNRKNQKKVAIEVNNPVGGQTKDAEGEVTETEGKDEEKYFQETRYSWFKKCKDGKQTQNRLRHCLP